MENKTTTPQKRKSKKKAKITERRATEAENTRSYLHWLALRQQRLARTQKVKIHVR